MTTSEFNSSLRFCESEHELRVHHAIHLFDSLLAATATASHGELISAIKDARRVFNTTPRVALREKEAELTAHPEGSGTR
jgi:hypothetical protein